MRQTASERSTIDVHAEARAASQLENPLDSINNDKDEVSQFTVIFPLNATQPSFSPVKKTKISKAEKTIAIEGSPRVTRGRKKRETNLQTESYSRDVLFADAHIQSPARNLVPFIL